MPLGDGSIKLIPQRPRSHCSVREAARLCGTSISTVYRLVGAALIGAERPSPRRIEVDIDQLRAHLHSSRDPEFWSVSRRNQFRAAI